VGRHRTRYGALGPRPKAYNDERGKPLPPTEELLLKTEYTELVGIRVKRLRGARGWTQRDAASKMIRPGGGAYSPGLLSRVENGYANPPLFAYVHLAEAFEVDPGRLLGSEESQKPISEAEMTLIRFLRSANVPPHEALTRLVRG
jgi:transcriptional regulator with XRE-family HTH domain